MLHSDKACHWTPCHFHPSPCSSSKNFTDSWTSRRIYWHGGPSKSSGLFDLRIVCDETGERAFSIQVLLVFQADMIISGRMLNVNSLIREEIELFWPLATVVACMIFLWDYIITLGMEVDLVWKSKWNSMKGLYLFQRYLPFTDIMLVLVTGQCDVVSYLLMPNFFYRSNGGNSEGDRV